MSRGSYRTQENDSQFQQEREEQKRIEQERADREALEVERLRQLADAQVSPSDYHGYDLPDPVYSGTDYSFEPEPFHYRPPTGWDYETDTPQITYYEMFGEPSLADIDEVNFEIDRLLESESWSEAERQEIENTRASFLAGEINPHSMNVKKMYADFNIKEREEFADKIADAGYEDYSLQATNLTEAKAQADEVYMDVLRNAYEENPSDELKKAIDQGPLDFDKIEDVQLYDSLSEDSTQRQAFDAQGAVVEDYLNRSDNRVFDTRMLEQGETVSLGYGTSTSQFMLNTGTIIGAPLASADNVRFGEFGSYGNLDWNNPPEPSTFEKNLSIGLDILSLVYPPLAPVFQGAKVLAQGGDLEDALKTGATVYVGGKVTKELTGQVNEVLDGFELTLPDMPEPVKQTLVDTTAGVLVGQDPDEAFVNSLKSQATDYATDWAAGEIESQYGDFGQDLKAFLNLPEDYEMPESLQNIVDETTSAFVSGDSASDAFVDAVEGEVTDFAGDIAEDAIKQGAGFIADALPDVDFETPQIIKDIGDTAVDLLEGPVDLISGAIEPVIDIADEAVDKFGSAVVDPALKAIDEVLPHGETPELPETPDTDVDLPDTDLDVKLVYNPPTQTESLFGDTIGKIYRTPIETYKPAFSQQEIQGMLSQRFRG